MNISAAPVALQALIWALTWYKRYHPARASPSFPHTAPYQQFISAMCIDGSVIFLVLAGMSLSPRLVVYITFTERRSAGPLLVALMAVFVLLSLFVQNMTNSVWS